MGSNLGRRLENCRQALRRIWGLRDTETAAVSSLYLAEPVAMEAGAQWFFNCALMIRTGMEPEELLSALLDIEKEMGRRRRAANEPRSIDLDLLLFDGVVTRSPGLQLPHPRMEERKFVLRPLAEIAPDFVHPVAGVTVAELLRGCPDRHRVRLFRKAPWW